MSKCIKTVVAVGIAVAVSVVAMANEVEQVNGAAGISGNIWGWTFGNV